MRRIPFSIKLVGLVVLTTAISIAFNQSTGVSGTTVTFIAQLALIGTLSAVSFGVPWSLLGRASCIFVMMLGVMVINIAIDLSFFSDTTSSELIGFLLIGSVTAFVFSLLVAITFPSQSSSSSMRSDLSIYFQSRSPPQWFGRFVASTFTYCILYLAIGAIAYQFTAPYYTGGELGLTVPSLSTDSRTVDSRTNLRLFGLDVFNWQRISVEDQRVGGRVSIVRARWVCTSTSKQRLANPSSCVSRRGNSLPKRHGWIRNRLVA